MLDWPYLFLSMAKFSPARWMRAKKQFHGSREWRLRVYTMLVVVALLAFIALAIIFDRKESLYYNIIILPVVITTAMLQKRLRIPGTLFVMLTGLFLLHAAGGGLYFGGVRLYDMFFGPFRYDNLVHFYGSFTVTFLAYNLVDPYLKKSDHWYDVYLQLIVIFMAAGLGTLVEIVEFGAVVWLHATGVGDYFNNALDLVVNMCGAITGSFAVMAFHRRRREYRSATPPRSR